MADTRENFTPASPDEREPYSFNFKKSLNAIDELESATFTLSEASRDPGVEADPDPDGHLDGAASVGPDPEDEDGDTRDLVASAWVQNLLPGITYRVHCRALTTAGAEVVLWSEVYCEPLVRVNE